MADGVSIHLPKDLADELNAQAAREGASVDDLAARAVEAHLNALKTFAFFDRLKAEADFEALDRVLNRVGGEPPRPGDEAD
jgi:hypothetical protein